MNHKTSIIILTYNNLALTIDCIESIRKYTKKDTYEIIVVDNHSTDDTVSWLKDQEDLQVILNKENVGFPKGCNIGIANASKDNDILLLNNDTIVTTNWLENLQTCLYSDLKIGAVGAVSNNGANLQGCDFTYENFEQMQELVIKNNVSDPSKWEEKICLIGFCMLIKREVIDLLEGLDEGYTPGYIEDSDLSLRIINLGYKLMLCHDAFIHHYLGTSFRKNEERFNQLILKNRAYFERKWNFSVFAFDETKNFSSFLAIEPKRMLDYHCEIGASLLRLTYLFPEASLYGVEEDYHKRKISSLVGNVLDNIEEFPYETFDTIFIGNELEKVENPLIFLHEIKKYLQPGGYLIGEFHNICLVTNFLLLKREEWYYTNFEKRNHFAKKDIERMFQEENFENGVFYPYMKELSDLEKEEDSTLTFDSSIYYYAFRFQKK